MKSERLTDADIRVLGWQALPDSELLKFDAEEPGLFPGRAHFVPSHGEHREQEPVRLRKDWIPEVRGGGLEPERACGVPTFFPAPSPLEPRLYPTRCYTV